MAEPKTLNKDLISEAKLSYDFYLEKLTLLLEKSYGVPEQIKMYVDFLNSINDAGKGLCNALGKYVKYSDVYEDSSDGAWVLNPDSPMIALGGKTSDLLDKIASIVGVSRNYAFLDEPLDNLELYILIYSKIVKNNFDGTYRSMRQAYSFMNAVAKAFGRSLDIHFDTDDSNPGDMDIYISEDASDNMKKLFMNGVIIFTPMGINVNIHDVNKNFSYYDGKPIVKDGEIEGYDEDYPYSRFATEEQESLTDEEDIKNAECAHWM